MEFDTNAVLVAISGAEELSLQTSTKRQEKHAPR